MAYISTYTVSITYRWKPAHSYTNKTSSTVVTVDAPNSETAVARAMTELNFTSPVYVLVASATSDGDGWWDYDE